VFDVSHNPDAARVLAENLLAYPVPGRTVAVLGMFKDKAAEEVALALKARFQHWYLGGLEGPRGQSAAALGQRLRKALPDARLTESPTVDAAYARAMSEAKPGDRVVVFGSFQTVAAVLKHS